MDNRVFYLSEEQLKEIALTFRAEFEKGLRQDNMEIQCLPTYITPKTSDLRGKALVLDLGGTNYRAAIVDFNENGPSIHPKDGWKKKLDAMKREGFTQEELFVEQADLISEIDPNQTLPIGYCFSYPAESLMNGDARLLRWTKGVNIKEMIGKPIGQPLLEYLNERGIADFTSVKVVNDTVASLFAGLANTGYDAYIGLIVGTGTNMATFVARDDIPKIAFEYKGTGLIPLNLESGNFTPPYLNEVDEKVDQLSDSPGRQRFEKAVSGMYLGELFKALFPEDDFDGDFNAGNLNDMINNPELYREEYVKTAQAIFKRSAQLVAASMAGLILSLKGFNPSIRKIYLTAEGSMFWSKMDKEEDYKDMVMSILKVLFNNLEIGDVTVEVEEKKNINLIGTAIAALS